MYGKYEQKINKWLKVDVKILIIRNGQDTLGLLFRHAWQTLHTEILHSNESSSKTFRFTTKYKRNVQILIYLW